MYDTQLNRVIGIKMSTMKKICGRNQF